MQQYSADEVIMRYIATALYTIACCFIFACIFAGYLILRVIMEPENPNEIARESFNPICTSEKHKAAKKYHGVLITEYRQDKREWGFYRKGKWCSLYRSIPKSYWAKVNN
jgi:hypothetical protein